MKTLIIVCDEKHQKYGDFLAQLVSLEDDKPDEIVGTKDGAVAAQVWLEKDYKANAATISSNQYILFIGNDKFTKDKRTHMTIKYDQFGMKYGWLGKQAALCVEEIIKPEEYEDFYTYATGRQENVERLIEHTSEPETDDAEAQEKKGFAMAVKKVPAMGLVAIKQLSTNRKIEEQQYSCLTYVFYLNGLSEFLGL